MKHWVWILALILTATAAWSANKTITVKELRDSLEAMQQSHKSDDEIATALKQFTLGEQLTHSELNSLGEFGPGPMTTEQLYILEGRSALLAPPPADLPATAAPDLAAQKAILAKAVDYVTKTFSQYPHLTASKNSARFQDGVETTQINDSGASNHMTDTSAQLFEKTNFYLRLIGQNTSSVDFTNGVERPQVSKKKTPWGQNGQISEGGPGPLLSVILAEAAAAGKLNWVRWELLDGKPMAVFSYAVDKKKSHYQVNYCCFPATQTRGSLNNGMSDTNFGSSTDWEPFKATVGYHGTLFIDPETGVIQRLTTQAELKPTDFVHQEDTRVDYGPVNVEGKTYFVPVLSFGFTELVPYGDNYTRRVSIRHTLFTMTYKDYQAAKD